jgi:hypothetical protein
MPLGGVGLTPADKAAFSRWVGRYDFSSGIEPSQEGANGTTAIPRPAAKATYEGRLKGCSGLLWWGSRQWARGRMSAEARGSNREALWGGTLAPSFLPLVLVPGARRLAIEDFYVQGRRLPDPHLQSITLDRFDRTNRCLRSRLCSMRSHRGHDDFGIAILVRLEFSSALAYTYP